MHARNVLSFFQLIPKQSQGKHAVYTQLQVNFRMIKRISLDTQSLNF